jgi:two-component system chemotaxis sensor kinase CheA
MATDRYKYFRVEARDLLEQLGQGMLDLEKGAAPEEVVPRLLRLAHTLKGAARVVRQPEIAEHAHELEDLFGALRDAPGAGRAEPIGHALMLLDRIAVRVAALSPGGEAPPQTKADSRLHEPVHAFRPERDDLELLAARVADAQTQVGALRPRLDQADRMRHLIDLIDDQLARIVAREGERGGDRTGGNKVLSMIDELRRGFNARERSIARAVDQVDRELRQVSDVAARLRLVPASAVFRFLERAARDTARSVGKRVLFEGVAADVRVDTDMLTIVQVALLQVVRNAVAHGIEPTERERRAAGKPDAGRVTVTVSRRRTSISFVCADDGRGIDFDAVRHGLQRKGMTPSETQLRDTDALLDLLLKGRISTAGTVTDAAGRGIGLDIVREAAERLGGKVHMRSEPGKGTTVELVVPSSMASFQALLVEADGIGAAVPLDAVRRTLRVTPQDIVETGGGHSVVADETSVPLLSLQRIVRPTHPYVRTTAAASAFIVESGDRAAAFTVDRVSGTGAVVMRPISDTIPAMRSIAGVSLDAGGEPRLVLDPVSLLAEAERPHVTHDVGVAARPSILVIDDSLTTRMLEQSILESAGYDVALASSGDEGLEKARATEFALFLVDVEMPGIDGFTFIERVRADARLSDIPAILVTSRASAEDRQRGRDVGAQGYIIKSDFDQVALLDRIRSLVQR